MNTSLGLDAIAHAEYVEFLRRQYEESDARYDELKRETERRFEVWAIYNNGETWKQKNGAVINIEDMTPNHAYNTLAMMERRFYRDAELLRLDLDHRSQWWDNRPLVRSLTKRASEEPTIAERIRDWRSFRAWKKGQNKVNK